MSTTYDIAVIGSGFAGSLLAMIARRLGLSVILIERGKHPRFAIGESSTPLSNLLLEDLAARYQLPHLAPLCKWGPWQTTYPGVASGLKRGFTFCHHRLGDSEIAAAHPGNQLLVAASPHDAISDTHWYRAEVDSLFVLEAQHAGVDYVDEVHLHTASETAHALSLQGERYGEPIGFEARFVVDATGPRGFLHKALALPEIALPLFPETEALFTHFRNVRRIEECPGGSNGDAPPYPVDDAAVHHVFDGGWIWVLRFNNGLTSAGVAATRETAARLRLSEGAPAWERLLDLLPAVHEQFRHAVPERPFVYAPRLSFRSGAIAGKRWALLPSAAGFVDPLMSTGFPLVLFGVARLAKILETDWESDRFTPALCAYARDTDADLNATAQLIGGLYAAMGNFPLFVSLSLLYFAAASFAEAARRLGRPGLAGSFLLRDHPVFHARATELLERARTVRGSRETDAFNRDLIQAIEPFNIAGLGDPARGNRYPASAEDFLRSVGKLGATRDEAAHLLERCGFLLPETGRTSTL